MARQLTKDFDPKAPKTLPPVDMDTALDDFVIGASTTSSAGRKLIQKWEGLYLKAYLDPVGVWTIGYGSINNPQLKISVKPGDKITAEQADEYMMRELRDMERQVNKLLKVPLKQYQYDAILSFTYNCGVGNLKKSTLLKLINQGNMSSASGQFLRWVKARDRRTNQFVTLKGLVNRRNDEKAMFEGRAVSGIKPEKIAPPVPKADLAPVTKPPVEAAKDVAKTTEGKTLGGSLMAALGSSAVYIGELLQNPWIAFGAGVVVTGLVVGLYLAWNKSREYE